MTKTKNTKNITKTKTIKVEVKPSRGRPRAVINFPPKGKVFTVKTLNKQFPKFTKVTIGKICKEAKEKGIITLIDKKISASNGKGRPELFYQFGKIKNVKMTFVPKKPVKKYKPKSKIKVIEKEIIKESEITNNPPPIETFEGISNDLAPSDIPELVES